MRRDADPVIPDGKLYLPAQLSGGQGDDRGIGAVSDRILQKLS